MAFISNILDFKSISKEKIKEDFNNYLKSLPDSQKWVDFYQSSNNQILLDLIAGFGTWLHYHIVTNRNETYLETANNEQDIRNIAITKGYRINRKAGALVRVKYDGLEKEKVILGDVVGYYKSVIPLTSIESKILNNGDTFECVIGNLKEFEFIIDLVEESNTIEIDYPNIDNNLIWLYYNDELKEWTNDYTEQFLKNIPVIRTYYDNSVQIVLNGFGFGLPIAKGDKIRVQFIDTLGSPETLIFDDDIEMIDEFLFDKFLRLSTLPDPKEKIKYIANSFFTSINRAVTLEDHKYFIISYQGIADANVVKIPDECGIVIYYILLKTIDQEIYYELTEDEKEGLINYLSDYSIIDKYDIRAATPLKQDINLIVVVNKDVNTIELEKNIKEIIKRYTYKVGVTVNLPDLIRDINLLDNLVSCANKNTEIIEVPVSNYTILGNLEIEYQVI